MSVSWNEIYFCYPKDFFCPKNQCDFSFMLTPKGDWSEEYSTVPSLFSVRLHCSKCGWTGTTASLVLTPNIYLYLGNKFSYSPIDMPVENRNVDQFIKQQLDNNLRSVFC